jgi:hypothetical protein
MEMNGTYDSAWSIRLAIADSSNVELFRNGIVQPELQEETIYHTGD